MPKPKTASTRFFDICCFAGRALCAAIKTLSAHAVRLFEGAIKEYSKPYL